VPIKKRFWTKYPGVYWIDGMAVGTNKPEKIFYIIYRRNGKLIEEKAGRQFQDDMTPARAASIRAERIEGKELSNKARREVKNAEENVWTIEKLWKEYKVSHSPKGIKTDDNRFEKHIKKSLGSKELKDLSPRDVDRVRVNLSKQLKPQTVKHILELLRRISNFAVEKRLCPGIAFKISMPKFSNLKTEDLNQDQLKNLLRAIKEDTHPLAGPLMKMALFTGMRRGELFKLQYDDVDFQRGFIRIRDPKGGEDQKIPLNDAVREILEKLPRGDSSYVFPGRGGNQRTDIKKAVNEIKKRAGLPKDFRPLHGVRHVFASMLASSGKVDLYQIQKLLTHKSPVMTQRYAHLRDQALKKLLT
jgi:integrase